MNLPDSEATLASLHEPPHDGNELEIQDTRHTTHEWPPLSAVQSRLKPPQSLLRETIFVGVLCMAQLMTQAGLGQAIAPLHIIGDSFGTTDPGQLSWFAAAYSLTVGTFILIAGRLGDLFGHKKLFIAGFVWYGIWSLLAGFSVYASVVVYDVFRALQGIGPAFLLPNAIAIIGRTYGHGRRQEMIFSIFGATAPGGFVVGATFSSLFGQLLWWPWAYWVMGIVCFVLAGLAFFVIPHTPSPVFDDTSVSILSRIDLPGSVLGVVGLVLVNFAWNQGPIVGWETPYTYSLLIVGILVLVAFGYVESRARFPLIPLAVLNSNTMFVLGTIAAGWSSFGIFVFYVWQLLEILREQTPLLSSADFVPCAFSGLAAAITTGFVLHQLSPSVVMLISMSAFTIGSILVATVPVEQTYWAQTFVAMIIMPWGMDMSFPAGAIILSNAFPHEHQGLAASLMNTVINYSISLGLGFAGTIESHINNGGRNPADILKGYRGAWYMGIGLSGSGVLISLAFCISSWRKSRLPEKIMA